MNGRIKHELEHAVALVIRRVGLRPGGLILAGLSGGPDSIALTHALLALRDHSTGLGYRVAAAHLNHGLRGSEADRDEAFVRAFCERHGLELVAERADGLGEAGGNLEERARECRHAFLRRVASSLGAQHIALAHHADDQAETVLLRLMRGSGMDGAAGMAEAGPGLLIRPMLGVRRSTVLAYLEEIGAAYVTDSSNLGAANARSRLRSGLAPLIESEYAPGFATRLGEFADEMRAADDYLKGQARAELSHRRDGGKRLDLNGFASLHPALAAVLLREFVRDTVGDLRRMNRAHIEAMRKLCLDPLPSGACNLPNGWRMRREYDFAVIELARGSEEPFAAELTTEAITEVAASGFEFDLRVHELAGPFFDINPGRFHTGPMESVFDAEVTSGGLVVRSFREGDRIRPLGMDGSRKVQDVFTDRKLPRERRKSWPLIATSGGEIVWIPQMARSRVALVTGATRKVLSLSARVIAPASIAALPRI